MSESKESLIDFRADCKVQICFCKLVVNGGFGVIPDRMTKENSNFPSLDGEKTRTNDFLIPNELLAVWKRE